MIICKTLLGHNNLDFSIACLQSFINNSFDEIQLEIFEDGSLTEADKMKLLSGLRNSAIVTKEQRDKMLTLKLANYSRCNQFRAHTIFAQKIFDIMLYDDKDTLFIDSDIFFLKKFILPAFENKPVFMADSENAYSFSPAEFFKIDIPIFPHINSGFFYFPKECFDLDFVESLLNDPIIQRGQPVSWLEQTIWAFLASRFGSINYFDDAQITMAKEKLTITADSIAIHLVSTYRYHFEQIKLLPIKIENEFTPVKLKNMANHLSKLEFAGKRVIKKLKRHSVQLKKMIS